MTYSAPVKDMQFVLHELAGLRQIQSLPGCEDATEETVAAVLLVLSAIAIAVNEGPANWQALWCCAALAALALSLARARAAPG